MTFRIEALPVAPFRPYFAMTDEELTARRARRVRTESRPGLPCRVSLAESEISESVLLLNHVHQPAETPYRASHAIFVREHARQAMPEPGEVPETIRSRLLSLRAFDAAHDITAAEVVEGRDLEPAVAALFALPEVDYIHIHYAKRGCYAAKIIRA